MVDGEAVERRLAGVAAGQDAVLSRADVLRAGAGDALRRRRVRSGDWQRLLRGSYLTEPWRTGGELQRSWGRSAALTVGGAVVGFGSAAALHGIEGVPRTGRVDVVVDHEVQVGRRRLVLHRCRLLPGDVVDLDGIPTTAVVRTLADLVPVLDRLDALAVLDSALRLGLVDAVGLAEAEALAARRRSCRGVVDLWSLADGRAESPLESRARLRCLEAGLVPLALQHVVRLPGGLVVARSDLAFQRRDPSLSPLLLEADGAGPHSAPEALCRDRWRANALVALGHPVVRCAWVDSCSRLAIPTMVRAAL